MQPDNDALIRRLLPPRRRFGGNDRDDALLIAAAILAVPSAVGAAPWSDVTKLASVNGGFNFVDKDGREVRTSAVMNCWAIKDAAKIG